MAGRATAVTSGNELKSAGQEVAERLGLKVKTDVRVARRLQNS